MQNSQVVGEPFHNRFIWLQKYKRPAEALKASGAVFEVSP